VRRRDRVADGAARDPQVDREDRAVDHAHLAAVALEVGGGVGRPLAAGDRLEHQLALELLQPRGAEVEVGVDVEVVARAALEEQLGPRGLALQIDAARPRRRQGVVRVHVDDRTDARVRDHEAVALDVEPGQARQVLEAVEAEVLGRGRGHGPAIVERAWMTRKLDPAALFETWKRDARLDPFPTWKAHLDAVRAGTKGMSIFDLTVGELGGEEARELMRLAFERDLVAVLQRDDHVFVARPEELWRIPACLALWKTAFEDGRWSDAAEAQMSLLLGYTDAQRRAWLAAQRARHAAWGSPTVYAILTADQRRAVVATGKRVLVDGMRLFHPGDRVLKRDAFRKLPAGATLARVAVRELVTDSADAALASNVQFLTRSGWR